MKERLLELIKKVTTIDNLIDYWIYDCESDTFLEYSNEKQITSKEFNDFFSDLYFEIAQYNQEERKVYGKGLLSLFDRHFLYQKNIFFGSSEDLENDFYLNFHNIPYDVNLRNQFNERKKEALQKGQKFINEIKERIEELCGLQIEENGQPLSEIHEFERDDKGHSESKKIKWIGTPSQFGFIIDLLIQGGYLDKPTSSFQKDAIYYSQHFEIDSTKTTLAKELSENTNSLATKNRNKIIIPHKDKLD